MQCIYALHRKGAGGNKMKKMFTLAVALLSLSLLISPAASYDYDTVIDLAIAANTDGPYAGSFDTLIAGVLAADEKVLRDLTRRGQNTVFAPTDDAFAELGLDENSITTLDQDALTDILLYHTANGRRSANSVLKANKIKTQNWGFLKQDAGVLTDAQGGKSNIIVTDLQARNGIVHVIDGVLMP